MEEMEQMGEMDTAEVSNTGEQTHHREDHAADEDLDEKEDLDREAAHVIEELLAISEGQPVEEGGPAWPWTESEESAHDKIEIDPAGTTIQQQQRRREHQVDGERLERLEKELDLLREFNAWKHEKYEVPKETLKEFKERLEELSKMKARKPVKTEIAKTQAEIVRLEHVLKEWGQPSVNWDAFKLLLKYGRRWLKYGRPGRKNKLWQVFWLKWPEIKESPEIVEQIAEAKAKAIAQGKAEVSAQVLLERWKKRTAAKEAHAARNGIKMAHGFEADLAKRIEESLKEHDWWHYEFHGECYIHGMMDGEAMAYQNHHGIQAQPFELR